MDLQKIFKNLLECDLIAMECTLKEMQNIVQRMNEQDSISKSILISQLEMLDREVEKFNKVNEILRRQMNDLL